MIGPSNQRTYDEFWSGDPAFVQLAENADDKAVDEHVRQIQMARETGNWQALRIADGPEPTRFGVKPMPGNAYRALCGMLESKQIDPIGLAPLAFRACIVRIDNGGMDGVLPRINDHKLGDIAAVKVTNYLDSIDLGIVSEIGTQLFMRGTQGLAPKS